VRLRGSLPDVSRRQRWIAAVFASRQRKVPPARQSSSQPAKLHINPWSRACRVTVWRCHLVLYSLSQQQTLQCRWRLDLSPAAWSDLDATQTTRSLESSCKCLNEKASDLFRTTAKCLAVSGNNLLVWNACCLWTGWKRTCFQTCFQNGSISLIGRVSFFLHTLF